MLFGKNKEKTIESKELLKKASRSSPKRLKELLKQIEAELVKGDNYDLQIAKTIITSRLTSMRDSG
ncbi:MAG: hypothetical protein ACXVH2_01855, partial [Methanobacterium sp.]